MADIQGRAHVSRAIVATGTAAYAAGDQIGGTISLTDVKYVHSRGAIVGISVTTLSGGSLPLSVLFFQNAPTLAADGDPATYAAADLTTNLCGVLNAATTDFVTAGSSGTPPCVATPDNRAITYRLSDAGVLYASVQARGAFTFAGTADLQIAVHLFQD